MNNAQRPATRGGPAGSAERRRRPRRIVPAALEAVRKALARQARPGGRPGCHACRRALPGRAHSRAAPGLCTLSRRPGEARSALSGQTGDRPCPRDSGMPRRAVLSGGQSGIGSSSPSGAATPDTAVDVRCTAAMGLVRSNYFRGDSGAGGAAGRSRSAGVARGRRGRFPAAIPAKRKLYCGSRC